MDDFDRVYQMIIQADEMPFGEMQYRAAEEALRMADTLQHEHLMFLGRMVLISSGIFGGHSDQVLPAFARGLTSADIVVSTHGPLGLSALTR